MNEGKDMVDWGTEDNVIEGTQGVIKKLRTHLVFSVVRRDRVKLNVPHSKRDSSFLG